MGVSIQSFLDRVRDMWSGEIEARRYDRLLEIQHLEDELKSEALTASERQLINRRIGELKGLHFDDLE